MREFIRKVLVLILVCFVVSTPVMAKTATKTTAEMSTSFSVEDVPEEVYFRVDEDVVKNEVVVIPRNSIVRAKTYQYQKERRWHKSGFMICQPVCYCSEDGKNIDVCEEELYFIVRKYEALDKKEAGITAAEITATTGVSIFLPGVDILYYFTKGAIQRTRDPNWFKAGVSNAYDNSIFWFCLKGKPIELTEGDMVKIQYLQKDNAEKMKTKIDKRHLKEQKRAIKKEAS